MRPLFCGNLEYDTHQSELERLFFKYGRVDRVDMKSGFAFIYFDDERDAEDAIRGLMTYLLAIASVGYRLSGQDKIFDRVISVEYALRDDSEKDDRRDSPRRDGYGRRDSPFYGRSSSPGYRRRPSPDYGRGRSPVYDRYNGPAYDRNRSPDYGRYRSRSPSRH